MRFLVLPILLVSYGCVSNISVVVDTGHAGIHHSKYWMSIHYDTTEDVQNKNIFYFLILKMKYLNLVL